MPRYFISPRIKVLTDNKILRPSVMAEQYSRKIGTRKRVGYAMAKRFIRRINGTENAVSVHVLAPSGISGSDLATGCQNLYAKRAS